MPFGPRRRKPPKQSGPKPLTRPKKARKLCPAGHRVSASWKQGQPCKQCERVHREIIEGAHARAAREGLSGRAAPIALKMRVVDTGELVTFSVPAHCRRRG